MKNCDRLPPHSQEAEQGVLGCIILDSQLAMGAVMEAGAKPDWFYDLRHQKIFEMALVLEMAEQPIDVLTLTEELKKRQDIEAVGGLAYVAGLPDLVPSVANLSYYLGILREKSILRRIIRVATDLVSRAYDAGETPDALLDDAEKEILAIRQSKQQEEVKTMKELVPEAIKIVEETHAQQAMPKGIPTGFIDLDAKSGGMSRGDLVIIAAFPSVGKSTLAMNIAEHAVVNLGLSVGVFTLEMTAIQLVLRCLCSASRINFREVAKGRLTQSDFHRMTVAAGNLHKARMEFDDSSELSIYQLRSKARRIHHRQPVDLWIVDYIQLMHAQGGGIRKETREQEVAAISRGLKALAKDTNAIVVALSQLNNEGRMRESGAIGQDADQVWKLRRVEEETTGGIEPIELFVEKCRNGVRGVKVDLTLMGPFNRFENASKVQGYEDHPGQNDGGYVPPYKD